MAAARLLAGEKESLTQLARADSLPASAVKIVASQHGDEARALLDDFDDFEAQVPESAAAQGRIDAGTRWAVALAVVIDGLENLAIAPAAPASDAAFPAAAGPVPLRTRLDAQTSGLLRAGS